MSQVTHPQRPERAVVYLDRLAEVSCRHAKFFGSPVAKPCHVLHAVLGQEYGPTVLADSGYDPYIASAVLAEDLQTAPRRDVNAAHLTQQLSEAFEGLKDFFRSDLAIDLSENFQADVLEQVLQVLIGMTAEDLPMANALVCAKREPNDTVQKEPMAEEDIDLLLLDIQTITSDSSQRPDLFKPEAPSQGPNPAMRSSNQESDETANQASAPNPKQDQRYRPTASQTPTRPQSKGQLAQDAAAVEEAVKLAFRSLTDEVAEGKIDPVIGREEEISRILKALQRRRKRSVILGGPAGVGKTALAEGVAIALRGQDVPESLAGRPVYELSLSALISGARYRGDFEERMTKAIERVKAEGAIVFIDEIHTIMGLGNSISKGMDAPNILKPALARGDILLIGATTTEEMAAIFEDKALSRRLDLIEIKEPDRKAMIDILERASWVYGAHHEVEIEHSLIPSIVDICATQLQDTCFPDKAFDVIDRACVEAAQDKALVVEIEHVKRAAEQLGAIFPKPPTQDQKDKASNSEALVNSSPLEKEDQDILIEALRRSILLPASYNGATLWLLTGEKPACEAGLNLLSGALGKTVTQIPSDMLKTPAASFFLMQGRQGEGAIFLREVETGRDKLFHFDEGEAFHESAIQALMGFVQKPVMQSNTGRRYATRGMHLVVTCRPETSSGLGFGAKGLRQAPQTMKRLLQLSGIHSIVLHDIVQADVFEKDFDEIFDLLQSSGFRLAERSALKKRVREDVLSGGDMAVGANGSLRDQILARMIGSPAA